MTGAGVGVAVAVSVAVAVTLAVAVRVGVAVLVAVAVSVAVSVGVGVDVVVAEVAVAVAVRVAVLVAVLVGVAVLVAVGVGVRVGVGVCVGVGVRVGVLVGVAVGVLLAVGVGVGFIPNATPLSLTFCGLFSALSAIASVPDSFVPLVFAAPVGLKVTDTMQVAGLAASVAPQVFTLTAKGPLGAIEVMLIAVLFGFDSVTVFADDTVSTVTLPNDSSFGLMPILRPAADAASGAHAKIATRIETTARFPVPIVHLAPPESKSGDVVMMKLQFRSRPPNQTCATRSPLASTSQRCAQQIVSTRRNRRAFCRIYLIAAPAGSFKLGPAMVLNGLSPLGSTSVTEPLPPLPPVKFTTNMRWLLGS